MEAFHLIQANCHKQISLYQSSKLVLDLRLRKTSRRGSYQMVCCNANNMLILHVCITSSSANNAHNNPVILALYLPWNRFYVHLCEYYIALYPNCQSRRPHEAFSILHADQIACSTVMSLCLRRLQLLPGTKLSSLRIEFKSPMRRDESCQF